MMIIGLLVLPTSAAAQALQPTGATPVDRLQARCDTIRPLVRRLHTSDALLRVNIGQAYNSMSQRLMARLNSRLALSRLDSAQLVAITARFETARTAFGAAYDEYEQALSALTKIDCRQKPTDFYQQLLMARDARYKVSKNVQNLNDIISDYRVAVETLRQSMRSKDAPR